MDKSQHMRKDIDVIFHGAVNEFTGLIIGVDPLSKNEGRSDLPRFVRISAAGSIIARIMLKKKKFRR